MLSSEQFAEFGLNRFGFRAGQVEIVTVALKYVNGQFITKYDEDQPRDEAGRFSSDGGGGAGPTEAQYNALEGYIGADYINVNSYLRSGKIRDEAYGGIYDPMAISNTVEMMNNLMSPIEQEQTLYRGILASDITETLSTLQPGDRFTDKGFVSTTQSLSFANNWRGDGLLIVIDAPAGTNAIDVVRVSGGNPNRDEYTNIEEEREVILQRDTTFEVVSNSEGRMEVKVVR